MILVMSSGCGEAMHSYIVVSVIKSRFMSFSAIFRVPFRWRGVPADHEELYWEEIDRKNGAYCLHGRLAER